LFDLLVGAVGVRHCDSPEIVGQLGLRIPTQHFALVNHEFLGLDSNFAQQFVEILFAFIVLFIHFLGNIPEADIQSFHIFNSQLVSVMLFDIIFDKQSQFMLIIDLICNSLPATALEVRPHLKNVHHSAALKSFVSHIQTSIIRLSFLVE